MTLRSIAFITCSLFIFSFIYGRACKSSSFFSCNYCQHYFLLNLIQNLFRNFHGVEFSGIIKGLFFIDAENFNFWNTTYTIKNGQLFVLSKIDSSHFNESLKRLSQFPVLRYKKLTSLTTVSIELHNPDRIILH